MTPEPCSDYLPLIVRAADGAIDADRRRELDAHVETCAACRDALAGQAVVHAALAARSANRASAGFADRVMAGIGRETSWLDLFDFRGLTLKLAPVVAAVAIAAYAAIGAGTASAPSSSAASDADVPVSAALMSDTVGGDALVPLMLFAGPDDSLTTALQETAR